MSDSSTHPNIKNITPDWLTIREAVRSVNRLNGKKLKKVIFIDLLCKGEYAFPSIFNHPLY